MMSCLEFGEFQGDSNHIVKYTVAFFYVLSDNNTAMQGS